MKPWQNYKLRLQRKRWLARAFRKRRELTCLQNRLGTAAPNSVLLFSAVRNEYARLPYFLSYYRKMGVSHFVFVDNDSTDGTTAYLRNQPDTSVWHTSASYRRARFGMDWINWLLTRYGTGHWTLTVDADEFLIFPHCDARPISALTDWLDSSARRSYGALLLDMYPQSPVTETRYTSGQNPLDVAEWFDRGNYYIQRNKKYHNLWISGGPRLRKFFANTPEHAPALNKIPLVKWTRGYAYVSSTHTLLPRGLNTVYDDRGGEQACGALLHFKFLENAMEHARHEAQREEHYARAREYKAYAKHLTDGASLWTPESTRYQGWRQLEDLGLVSSGGWL